MDFVEARIIARDLRSSRQLVDSEPDKRRARLASRGIPLTFSPPSFVLDLDGPARDRGVFLFSTRNDLLGPIAPTLTETLEHWYVSGCFSSGGDGPLRASIKTYHAAVKDLLDSPIRLGQNRWIKHSVKAFG